MKTWTLNGQHGPCHISLGARLEDLKTLARDRRMVIVTDSHVRSALGARFPEVDILEVGLGEASKTLATVESLWEAFMARNLDRGSLVVGVGGGIVCDLTGFAASTYLRGVAFGFAPTSLLAQVDAALGGKNGVNLGGFKNQVGLVRQPEFVWVDPSALASLPEKEFRCGLAEIVKAAAIADRTLFELLEQNGAQIRQNPEGLSDGMTRAIEVKLNLVQQDEGESGVRMFLNFGHTLGHALETASGGHFSHGEAVSMGMVAASRLSVRLGLLEAHEAERLEQLLERLGLPTAAPADLLKASLANFAQDKKRRNGRIHWVLLKTIGQGVMHTKELRESERLLSEVQR